MTLNHNLQEQLRFLQENLSECHFSGFQYAPTASENIEVPAVFNFDTQKTMNSRNCSKQSVSDAGYLDLQTFRTEQSSANTTNHNEASQLLRVPITSNNTRSKYTTPVSAPIAPRKKTSYNLQDEISRFQSAEPDSVFMDIDIDALVAAELAKADNTMRDSAPMVVDLPSLSVNVSNTSNTIPTSSYPTPVNTTTSTMGSMSAQLPSNLSYPTHTNPAQSTTYANSTAYPSAPSTAHTARTVHTVSSVASSNDLSSLHHSGSSTYSNHGTVTGSGAVGMVQASTISNSNSSNQDSEAAARAVKEAELQKVKHDMRRYS